MTKNETKNTQGVVLAAPTYDRKTILAAVNKAARANKSAAMKAGEARVLAAEATYLVVTTGAIGKGGVYATQSEYVDALGVSPGQVTGLKRLGRALAIGCKPTDPAWGLLSSKAGTKEVGAIFGDDLSYSVTPEKVYAALKKAFTPDGQRNGAKEARKTADEKKAEKKDDSAVVTSGMSVAEQIDAAVSLLSRLAKDLDREAWASLESRLGDIVTRENTIRAKIEAPKPVRSRKAS